MSARACPSFHAVNSRVKSGGGETVFRVIVMFFGGERISVEVKLCLVEVKKCCNDYLQTDSGKK